MRILCTILARAGSKGIRNKNVRIVGNQPLITHTIQQALKVKSFDAIAVSSDSDTIHSIASKWGIQHLVTRPEELANDNAPKIPAIRHCLLEVERKLDQIFDIIVDLDPTSPLRSLQDIIGCLDLLQNGEASNVITASPARKSPYFNLVEIDDRQVVRPSKTPSTPLTRRQDAPACYDMNASIYAWWRKSLIDHDSLWQSNTRLYVMPAERSVDIDHPIDLEFVDFLLTKYQHHESEINQ